jgi:small conductance mechanosensitive channel
MDYNEIMDYGLSLLLEYGPAFVGAIIVLILGFWITNIVTRILVKIMNKRNVEPSLVSFVKSFLRISLKILIIVTVLGMIGVAMTSFIAILGAAGLAVGLALQGSLANFAGGVLILIFKPFKVGEFIEAQGFMGTVSEIQIFNTILLTIDNKRIVIPNGNLSNNVLTNFSSQETRRVEWTFGVAYGTDYDKTEQIIMDVLKNDQRILSEPEPFIALKEMADSSVNIVARVWTKLEDFWPVYWEINKNIYKAFNEKGIEIPFPQVDVHMKNK